MKGIKGKMTKKHIQKLVNADYSGVVFLSEIASSPEDFKTRVLSGQYEQDGFYISATFERGTKKVEAIYFHAEKAINRVTFNKDDVTNVWDFISQARGFDNIDDTMVDVMTEDTRRELGDKIQ